MYKGQTIDEMRAALGLPLLGEKEDDLSFMMASMMAKNLGFEVNISMRDNGGVNWDFWGEPPWKWSKDLQFDLIASLGFFDQSPKGTLLHRTSFQQSTLRAGETLTIEMEQRDLGDRIQIWNVLKDQNGDILNEDLVQEEMWNPISQYIETSK